MTFQEGLEAENYSRLSEPLMIQEIRSNYIYLALLQKHIEDTLDKSKFFFSLIK